MRTGQLTLLSSLLLAAAAVSGCDAESVPFAPTFAADVRPIMISRCVRCHGGGRDVDGGAVLNNDPKATGSLGGMPVQGYFFRLEDVGCDPTDGGGVAATCQYGLGHYTKGVPLMLLQHYIHSDASDRMPPPPAPKLTDRQLQVMDRWLAEPDPQ